MSAAQSVQTGFWTTLTSFKQLPDLNWLRRGDRLPGKVRSRTRSTDDDWIAMCEIEESGSRLSDWFPNATQLELEEDIVGLGSYGRILTILLAEWSPEDGDEEASETDAWIDRWSKGHFRGEK